MQDTARWDGIPPCALARGSDRGAPTLPSSAHKEGRPSVLVELRPPDVDEKNCETNPITSQESWRNLAWSDAERYGCRGELRAGGACRLALLLAWLQGVPGSRALVNACAAWRVKRKDASVRRIKRRMCAAATAHCCGVSASLLWNRVMSGAPSFWVTR